MRILILFIVSLSGFLIAKSQSFVYHPFPDSNASWNVNVSQQMCFMGGSSSEDYSLFISGDTVIENQIYHKLSTPYVQYSISGGCTQLKFPGYKGAIRQDINTKKVFYRPPSQSSEELLYDFTLEVGDTIKGYLESFTYTPDVITEIDSILIGENYHKRWLINPCYGIYLIEGIGSTFGLIEPSPGCITDMDYYSLTCFNQNGQKLYPYHSAECQLITSTNKTNITSQTVRVFPNPSYGSFTVDFSIQKNITEIWLTNLVGNIVFRKKIDNQNNVIIANLPGGTYILTIVDDKKRKTIRKIISCPYRL